MKKGVKPIIGGFLLFLIGGVLLPFAVLLPLILNQPVATRFNGPGEFELPVEEKGRYYLWNEYRVIFEGKNYVRSQEIPDGMQVIIRNEKGEVLPFVGDTSISSSRGSDEKQSVGYVNVLVPGKLKIAISEISEPRVFSFSQSTVLQMMGLIFAGLAISGLLAVSGIALVVWGVVILVREGREVC